MARNTSILSHSFAKKVGPFGFEVVIFCYL